MGLFGKIGKIAGSTVVKKVEDELTKKQNREQTKKYCYYIHNNINRICIQVEDLSKETKNIINEINSRKGAKLSFKEKGEIRKLKENAIDNLQYLYLIRDFFTVLAKNTSGIALENEELMLVTKFSPYFDGVPVMDIDNEDVDDSILGTFKEVGKDIMSVFVSPKKSSSSFDFEEYLYRYEEKIDELILPNTNNAIDNFKNAFSLLEQASEITNHSNNTTTINQNTIVLECPNCKHKLNAESKFCPECGTKIEVAKNKFCSECGAKLESGVKFCSECGTKVS